jgi:hypothetical protein
MGMELKNDSGYAAIDRQQRGSTTEIQSIHRSISVDFGRFGFFLMADAKNFKKWSMNFSNPSEPTIYRQQVLPNN